MSDYVSFATALEKAEHTETTQGPGPSTLEPIILIPSFWTRESRTKMSDKDEVRAYDHPIDIGDPNPSLRDTLQSLVGKDKVETIVIILGVTDPSLWNRVDARVREIVAEFPELNVIVIGEAEIGSLTRRLEHLELQGMIPSLTMNSYGAIRNIGLIVAAILGRDSIVFIDDDEVVEDQDFIERGLFGLGLKIHDGGLLLSKTGYYVDKSNRAQRADRNDSWTDVFWRKDKAYNEAMSYILEPPRLQRAHMAFGGCMSIHKDLYTKIAFDPWVVRGEDFDYLINIKLHGGEMFIDDQWKIKHLPPESRNMAQRFRQNVFRFIYEHRKLEFAKSQVDLIRVTPEELMPYPGEFINNSISIRAIVTSLLRAIAGPDRDSYFATATKSVGEAEEYARRHCADYFAFQRAWGVMMNKLWKDMPLASNLSGERTIDRTGLTGEFPRV